MDYKKLGELRDVLGIFKWSKIQAGFLIGLENTKCEEFPKMRFYAGKTRKGIKIDYLTGHEKDFLE